MDAYDQLISSIKTTNPACKVCLCEIGPRGDVTVTGFIRFTASAFRKLLSIYVFSYFPFGFVGRMWDCISS